jgi:hypothetical protein
MQTDTEHSEGTEPWPFSSEAGEVLAWRDFHLGIEPGIHSGRWPGGISPELRVLLSRDQRSVSLIFGSFLQTPWYRNPSDTVVSMILERPAVIPRLHLLLSAATGRDLLPKLISSRDRRSLSDFLGSDILEMAQGRISRWKLPDLSAWISPGSDEVTRDLSKSGATVLLGALADTPEGFRKRIFLCLPPSLEGITISDDKEFHGRCREFVTIVARKSGLVPHVGG